MQPDRLRWSTCGLNRSIDAWTCSSTAPGMLALGPARLPLLQISALDWSRNDHWHPKCRLLPDTAGGPIIWTRAPRLRHHYGYVGLSARDLRCIGIIVGTVWDLREKALLNSLKSRIQFAIVQSRVRAVFAAQSARHFKLRN